MGIEESWPLHLLALVGPVTAHDFVGFILLRGLVFQKTCTEIAEQNKVVLHCLKFRKLTHVSKKLKRGKILIAAT